MYKRLESIFCGHIRIVDSSIVALRKLEVLIRVSIVAFSEVDRAIAKCLAICLDSHALGSSAVGRVIGVGVSVDPSLEGRRVSVRPWCFGAPLLSDGYAQELASVHHQCLDVVPKGIGDVDALLAQFLSVPKELLEELDAREVMILGRDLSILPFATYAKERASRVFSVPSETPLARVLGIEATSAYGGREFDVVVVSSLEPHLVSMALGSCRRGGVAIVHPALLAMGLAKPLGDCKLLSIRFEGLREGLSYLEANRGLVFKLVKEFHGLEPRAVYEAPSVAHLLSNEDRKSKRMRR